MTQSLERRDLADPTTDGAKRTLPLLAAGLVLTSASATFLGLWIVTRHSWAALVALTILPLAFTTATLALRRSRADFVRNQATSPDTANLTSISVNGKMDPPVASLVISAIAAPQTLIRRIKQSVTPLSRAFMVDASYTMSLPKELSSDAHRESRLYIPLIASKKGKLHDHLSIRWQGVEVPTLTFHDSTALVASSIRTIVKFSMREHYNEYKKIEGRILSVVADRRRGAQLMEKDALDAGALLTATLPDTIERRLIIEVVKSLSDSYFIVATLPRGADRSWVTLETSERAILNHTLALSEEPGRLQKMADWFRKKYGVRSAQINFPIDAAYRSSSYHLEIMGPPHSYLARQAYRPRRTPDGSGYRRLRARRAQRYLHFYARDLSLSADSAAWRDSEEAGEFVPAVSAWFHERPPGSMGVSAITAGSAFLLLIAVWSAAEGVIRDGTPRSDTLALLLAVPGAMAGWIGIERGSTPVGGTLSARVSATVTVVLCLVGSLQFVLGGTPSALIPWVPSWLAWSLLIGLALANALVALYAWYKRAALHDIALDRKDLDASAPVEES